MSLLEQSTVLSSWKDIARYMGKGVRTVQRWEHDLGLPVRRPIGASQKSAIVLNRSDLESWLETRFSARKNGKIRVPAGADSSRAARAALRESIGESRELRSANLALARQLNHSLRRLTEQCNALCSLSNQVPMPAVQVPGSAGASSCLVSGSDRIA